MFLLNVPSTRLYCSAVLVAILLLASPNEYHCHSYNPVSYTYGWPKYYDERMHRRIQLARSPWGRAIYKTTINLKWEITRVKFTDNLRNGPKIWISRWPPCFNPDVAITSPSYERIDITMEVYYSRP